MKKILFTILLMAAAINTYAYDFSAVCSTGQTLYYNISNGAVNVTFPSTSNPYYGYTKPTGYLHIPDSVIYNGHIYAVKGISSYAFYQCTGIDELVIPDNVTSVGSYAFSGCTNIHKLVIPDNVTSIEGDAFSGCSGIDSLWLGSGLTSIGSSAFGGCSGLKYMYYNAQNCSSQLFYTSSGSPFYNTNTPNFTTLVIGDSVKSIPLYAFYNRSGLDKIVIPDNVTSVGSYAFSGCSGIDSLCLGSGLTSISSSAFSGCTNIHKLIIPDNVTSIESSAFYGCSGIDSIWLGSGLTSIGSYAFQGCSGLKYMYYNARHSTLIIFGTGSSSSPFYNTNTPNFTTLVIGDSVKSIPQYAFYNRSSLDKIVIPDNVTSIGSSAFYGCSGIDSLWLGSGLTSIGSFAFSGCTNIHRLVIPDNVTSIGSYAFSGCSGIDSLWLGSGLTSIGSSAFWRCGGLKFMYYNAQNCSSQQFGTGSYAPFYNTNTPNFTTLVIGDSVRSIPQYAFYGRSGLEELIIPDNVTSIGQYAFYNCSGIDSLWLGSGLTSIGSYAFQGCYGLKFIFYNAKNYSSGLFSAPFDNTSTPNLTSLIIGDSVRSIPQYAFYNRSGLDKIVIPDNVTSIGSSAFSGCSGIDSLWLGSGLKTIENEAFKNCSNIKKLAIPDSVSSIGNSAFQDCSGIDSLWIGSGLTSIGNNTFQGCGGLKYMYYNAQNCSSQLFSTGSNAPFYNTNTPNFTTLVIGDSVKSIPQYAFYNRSGLDKIVIPDNVTSVGSYAFSGCSGIDSLWLGSGLTSIGSHAFRDCTNIHKLIIPDNVTNIWDYAFSGCSGIDSLWLGSGLTSIRTRVFAYCSGFHSLVIHDNITSIGEEAFYGCYGIDSLWLGSGLTSIGSSAFQGCIGLNFMYYNAGKLTSKLFDTRSGSPFYNTNTPNFITLVIGDSVKTIMQTAFRNKSSLHNLVILDSVTSIGSDAFYGCSGIDSLWLGNGLTSIGAGAFQGCTNIHKLIIPDNVTSIENSAFSDCSGIDSLWLGNGLKTIGNYAFQGCSNIHKLIIPDSVTSIGSSAFSGCFGIDSLWLGSGLTYIGDVAFQGCIGLNFMYYNAVNCTAQLFQENYTAPFYNTSTPNFTTLIIGDSIRSIPQYTFYNRSGLNKLVITDNVTSIGDYAFSGCSGIDSLCLGSGLKTIGNYAFQGCRNIPTLIVPDGVNSIGENAFVGCSNLTNVTMGFVQTLGTSVFKNCDSILSVTTNARNIGNNAFAKCDRLVSVTLGDSVRTIGNGAFNDCFRLMSVSMGDNVASIGKGAFSGCVRLQNMQFDSGLQTLGDSAFYGCSLIHDITLPEGLTTVGGYAFAGCGGIHGTVEFPSTTTSIGSYAFKNSGNVNRIIMRGDTPPIITANSFATVSPDIPVEVPCGAVLNYYTTDYWENFSNLREGTPHRLTVSAENSIMGTATITQQPTCSNSTALINATAYSGYHFLRWNDGNTANPRQLQVTQDTSFKAIFVVNNSYITVASADQQQGSASGTGLYGYLMTATLTATPVDGYHFLRWNDGNTQNPRYVQATQDSSFTAFFASNTINISIVSAQPDMGTTSGSGIYYWKGLVIAQATPNYGYHFTAWSDGVTENPRNITAMQDSCFTAHFDVNFYAVNVSVNHQSMGSATGTGSYAYLHEMQMEASSSFGYHFVQWNDGSTDNPRNVTVSRDTAFTAQFAANSYTINVESNEPLMGSAYGGGSYTYGSSVSLAANPTYGYHFAQWSDGVTDNPRTISIVGDAQYIAIFELNTYDLTAASGNPAMGTASGGGTFGYLSLVYLTANPNAGYHFTQWSDGNTDNPRLVSVTQNATYTAQFAINSYAVGVQSNNTNMGGVSGSGTYNHNSTATLTASAYYGYHFVQWQDGNTENPRSVVVTDSAQYTALFDYNSYLVTANSSNVTLGSAMGGGSYNYLSQVALTAVAAPHYHFTMWNDSIEDNPRTITVTRDTVFTAHFAIDRHTIGVLTDDATLGTTSGSDTVDYNTAVWIGATANYGYHFTAWNDGNSSNPRRVVISQDTLFTASFAPNQYLATCMVNDSTMGTAAIATSTTQTGMHVYQGDYLTSLTFTATAHYGYHFTGWNDGVMDNPRTLTLRQDTSLTALFAVNTYTVSVAAADSTMGTVGGSGTYNYLSQVNISATASAHHHFLQWNDGNTSNPRMVTLTSDTAFTAIFEEDEQYTIVVNVNDSARGNLTVGSQAGVGSYEADYYIGENVTLIATANEHYYFSQWSDGVTSNPRVVTVIGAATYTAVFEPVRYPLIVTANDYSMGSVSGTGSYPYGSTVTIAAQAFDNYRFIGWSDGDTMAVRSITVTGDMQFEAHFEARSHEGIDNVDEEHITVSVADRRIIVFGNTEDYTIYDLAGRRHAPSETLAPGVYLVQVGRWTKKVVVR